jgi:branched-subunit amino acid aminotransferase/4-amino-4-deoxychorismate lyase
LARLSRSAAQLGFASDLEAITRGIFDITAGTDQQRLRLRLVAFADGLFELFSAPEPMLPPDTIWRVKISGERLDPLNPLIAHKTTARQFYDEARAVAKREHGADEVVFLNPAGEVCEGGISSVFVERGRVLLTPAIGCGLLPGVLRASLIASGEAREARLAPPDLSQGFLIGNAVRGLVRAWLVD